MKIVFGSIGGWSIVNGILLFHADAMIKMLLMFRALRDSMSPKAPE